MQSGQLRRRGVVVAERVGRDHPSTSAKAGGECVQGSRGTWRRIEEHEGPGTALDGCTVMNLAMGQIDKASADHWVGWFHRVDSGCETCRGGRMWPLPGTQSIGCKRSTSRGLTILPKELLGSSSTMKIALGIL